MVPPGVFRVGGGRPAAAGAPAGNARDGIRDWPLDPRRDCLAAESKPSDDGPVARIVLLHQVGEKPSTLSDELEEAASRMVVLGKAPEMIGQRPDPLGEERDLDFR